jgi:hypothetical protein
MDNARGVSMSNVTAQSVEVKVKPDFGNGRYSALMEEVFHDGQTVFNLSSEKSEKLAKAIATELGSIMASQRVDVKLGKANKDGKLTISEACKLKGFTITRPIGALRALHYAADAGKNGFSFANTKWQPVAWLTEYFTEL